MESPQDKPLGQDELLKDLMSGFEALLRKVEDLALKNADFELQINALRADVGLLSPRVTLLSTVMKRRHSSRSGAALAALTEYLTTKSEPYFDKLLVNLKLHMSPTNPSIDQTRSLSRIW